LKTFKLCTLRILMDESGRDTTIPVTIKDGLTVSTDQTAQWVAEIVVLKNDQPIIDELFTKNLRALIEITISRPDNDPAAMIVTPLESTPLSEGVSYLFKGKMVMMKNDLSESILREVVEDHFTGEALIQEYKDRRSKRGAHITSIAKETFKQYLHENPTIS